MDRNASGANSCCSTRIAPTVAAGATSAVACRASSGVSPTSRASSDAEPMSPRRDRSQPVSPRSAGDRYPRSAATAQNTTLTSVHDRQMPIGECTAAKVVVSPMWTVSHTAASANAARALPWATSAERPMSSAMANGMPAAYTTA